jgi:hypothetical protein
VVIGGSVLAAFVGLEAGPSLVGCDIKGHISFNTGEKIYHVPGQEYYWKQELTRLRASAGSAQRKMLAKLDGERRGTDACLRSPGQGGE